MNTKAKHSPGPWVYKRQQHHGFQIQLAGSMGWHEKIHLVNHNKHSTVRVQYFHPPQFAFWCLKQGYQAGTSDFGTVSVSEK